MLQATTTQVAGGDFHTCAVTSAGGVQCWGYNFYGQLGNGTSTDSHTPAAVTGLASGVVAIAAGSFHTCVLTTSGGVQCWGFNSVGQLGNGTTTISEIPVPVTGLSSGVAAIAVNGDHSCALTIAGGVQCWGANANGELGNGVKTDSHTPVPVTGLSSGIAAIATGVFHTCAVSTAGALQCWGDNGNGELGNGATTDSDLPVPVTGLSSGVAAVAANGYGTCALTVAGAVQCWGINDHGQLGNGTMTDSHTAVQVTALTSGVAAISMGFDHTCALTTSGAVRCWGDNGNGELGNATTTDSSTPVTVLDSSFLPLQSIAAITASGSQTCALTTVGGVLCWGSDGNGELGNSTTTDSATPVAVVSLTSDVAAIAGGESFTCALMPAGGVTCWGANSNGQLGNGTTTDSATPVPVTGLSSGVVAVATGGFHACALSTGGTVLCWGSNSDGQLGNGTLTASPTPLAVSGLTGGVVAITAGYDHTCALTSAGALKCWGDNADGQLGNGSTTNSETPVAVTGLSSGVAGVSAATLHTCALTSAGGVQCWGYNGHGGLGNGTTTNSQVPIPVTGLSSGVARIAAAQVQTCALTTAGAMQCWGSNSNGQLGDGTITDRHTPVQVLGLAGGVASIAMGDFHSCAINTAGALKCWGYNLYGQLGNGTITDSDSPTAVSGLSSGVAMVTAGGEHTCALTATGTLQCWGYNANGQLGNGSTTDAHVPVSIVAGQTIAFAPSQRAGVGDSVTLSAVASGGGAVSFDSWTHGTCTFSGGKLVLTNIGLCGVRASQSGGSDGSGGTFAAAPQQLRLIRVEADLIFASGFDANGGLSE